MTILTVLLQYLFSSYALVDISCLSLEIYDIWEKCSRESSFNARGQDKKYLQRQNLY